MSRAIYAITIILCLGTLKYQGCREERIHESQIGVQDKANPAKTSSDVIDNGNRDYDSVHHSGGDGLAITGRHQSGVQSNEKPDSGGD